MTTNYWPFLPPGRIYSSLLAMLRAFWSLEPQAYLIKTYIRQKHSAEPHFMMHKQIIRPHFAISTCCTVLSSRGDDPSWIQYEALFLLSMKSQEQTFYSSYLFQMHHISSRPWSSDRSPPNIVSWKQSAGHSKRDAARCTREGLCNWKTSWKLYPYSLASKKWGALEAPWQMTPTGAAFVCCKACDIVAEDAFSIASQHSIALIYIKWALDMSEKFNLFQWEFPSCSNIISCRRQRG